MRNSKSYVTAFKQNKLIKPKKIEFSPDNFGSPSIYIKSTTICLDGMGNQIY